MRSLLPIWSLRGFDCYNFLVGRFPKKLFANPMQYPGARGEFNSGGNNSVKRARGVDVEIRIQARNFLKSVRLVRGGDFFRVNGVDASANAP